VRIGEVQVELEGTYDNIKKLMGKELFDFTKGLQETKKQLPSSTEITPKVTPKAPEVAPKEKTVPPPSRPSTTSEALSQPSRVPAVGKIVEAVNLKKTYMLGKIPVEALRGVNLKVESGDFLAVLGPSGSGKSTLLNLVGALDKPTAGTLLIDGVDVSKLSDNQLSDLRSRVGFVFQFFNLIPRFTARDNVELSLSIAGMGKAERKKRAEELLETVGLKDRINHKPAELSGGQQQRVAIARALANNPRFLLMDEPTGNIDSRTAREIMRLVKRLNAEKGVTIIMVTHDQHLAREAKRMVQMFDGVITSDVANGEPT
jgi:putative ABC transport system ATP-binding protein